MIFITKKQGKCPFRQYISSKPARYGIKYWCLVDTEVNYLLDVNCYLGKAEASSRQQSNIGMNTVLTLTERYYNTKRCVTADNFFTSIPLALELWKQNLEFIGTMNKNKLQIPAEFKPDKSRKLGSTLFAFKDCLTIVSYVPKANKAVILLSTKHHESKINSTTNKPDIIMDYNQYKGIKKLI